MAHVDYRRTVIKSVLHVVLALPIIAFRFAYLFKMQYLINKLIISVFYCYLFEFSVRIIRGRNKIRVILKTELGFANPV